MGCVFEKQHCQQNTVICATYETIMCFLICHSKLICYLIGDEIKFRVTRTKFVSYLPPDSDETEKDAEGADKQTVDVDDLSLEPHYSIEVSL